MKRAPALLTVDVGNTNVVLGLYRGEVCEKFWRVSTEVRRTSDEYATAFRRLLADSKLDPRQIKHIVIGSVVPVLSMTLENALFDVFGLQPFTVTHDVSFPVKNLYAHPREVGIDRLANAAGAVLKLGAPVIVADLGTAVTIDVISRDAEYLGGAILPGINMSAEALSERTARLPLASIKPINVVIGRTTVQSIRSGVIHGMVGAVEYLIRRTWEELGYSTPTVATGGFGGFVTKESELVHDYDPELTLRGLKSIWELNCARESGN